MVCARFFQDWKYCWKENLKIKKIKIFLMVMIKGINGGTHERITETFLNALLFFLLFLIALCHFFFLNWCKSYTLHCAIQ